MQNILLSVVIPLYNASQYVEQCLTSLQSCKAREVEFIFVNDGSSDDSAQHIEKVIAEDNRIQLINQENGGVSKARNTGMEAARGSFVTFLDADDFFADHALERMLSDLKAHPADFMAYAYNTLFDDGKIQEELFEFQTDDISEKAQCDRIMYASSRLNACWAKIFRMDLIRENHLLFPVGVPVGEDLQFVFAYYPHAGSFRISNTPVLMYRQHAGSAMRRYGIKERLDFTRPLYRKSMQYVQQINDPELKRAVDVYYFRVLTNLCREFATDADAAHAISAIYGDAMTEAAMEHLRLSMIPGYKKPEYLLMRTGCIAASVLYFRVKAKASTK